VHRDGDEEGEAHDFMKGVAREFKKHLERKQRGHENVEAQSVFQSMHSVTFRLFSDT